MTLPSPRPDDSYPIPALDPRDESALALLGHDLRAAVSEVIGGLRLIDPAPLPPATRQQIARTKAAGEALALLLEQALTLLVENSDISQPNAAPLQTDRLLDGIRLRWDARATECGLTFDLHAAPGLPSLLPIDGAMVERVLSNLLGNAIKYAGSGNIHCGIDLSPDRQLQITVQDQGPGFPPTSLPSLFSNPHRTPAASKPGSGLGLHIVHDMVSRAGGTIIARNPPSGGAQVIVRLPVHGLEASLNANLGLASLPDLGQCRVLVADDSPTQRSLMQQMLGSMGAEVVTAADGAEAIGRIERESFDLLVLDIEMPRFNGLDVMRHIRAMPGPVARLPILAATAYRMRANKAAIETAGANAILSKPVASLAALGAAVAEAMLREAPPSDAPGPTPDDTADNGFARLLQMAGPAAADVVDQMHKDLRFTERGLLAASHGLNWSEIRQQTHVLIALSGTAGAHQLQHLAEEMNTLAHSTAPDRGTFLNLLPQLLEKLDALIHFVSGQSPEQKARP